MTILLSMDDFAKNMQKPLARWTIGNCTKDGLACLKASIESFQKFYDTNIVICYNCNREFLGDLAHKFEIIDQKNHLQIGPEPKGVSWKLYPPRLNPEGHEIVIDNDIIFENKIDEIDMFFKSDVTLLLEGDSRTYGRFEKHVPKGFQINSGIYGMPPKDRKSVV